jgi:hypothetical protein
MQTKGVYIMLPLGATKIPKQDCQISQTGQLKYVSFVSACTVRIVYANVLFNFYLFCISIYLKKYFK